VRAYVCVCVCVEGGVRGVGFGNWVRAWFYNICLGI